MANTANGVPTLSDLFERWEREHWNARSVDFADDRRDWLNLTDDERWQWYWLAGFSHFRKSETHAVICLSMLMPCLRCAEQQRVLGMQIADESRHADFFERFHEEVLLAALPTAKQGPLTISAAYQELFIDSLTDAVRKAADEPSHTNVAVAVLQLFIMLEGSIALATFSVVRRLLTKTGKFPGLLKGMTHAHQDEVRHAQLGLCILQDMFTQDKSTRGPVIAHLQTLLPLFSDILIPRPGRKAILESLGLNPFERRQRAFSHLQRHLQLLGIDAGVVEPWIALPSSDEKLQADQNYERESA